MQLEKPLSPKQLIELAENGGESSPEIEPSSIFYWNLLLLEAYQSQKQKEDLSRGLGFILAQTEIPPFRLLARFREAGWKVQVSSQDNSPTVTFWCEVFGQPPPEEGPTKKPDMIPSRKRPAPKKVRGKAATQVWIDEVRVPEDLVVGVEVKKDE